MVASCPNCAKRIRIQVPHVIERNLVRCSECWSVFLISPEDVRALGGAGAPLPAPPDEGELSRRFAEWEKKPLNRRHALLDDAPVPPGRQGGGGEDDGEESDVGEGTILSAFRESAAAEGEVLCTLSVVEGPRAGLSFPVQRPTFVLGREASDGVLADPEVSRRHARIEVSGQGGARRFEVEDLGSTNGLRVNGTRVGRAVLENFDELELGATKLIFFAGKPPRLPAREPPDGRGRQAERGEAGDPTGTAGQGNRVWPERLPLRLKASLEVVQGPDRGLVLDFPRGSLVIGRDLADLRLSDPQVSRKHAVVEVLSTDQFYVKDLASKNGTAVNGILVKVARLRPGDSIQVGDTKMVFSAEVFS